MNPHSLSFEDKLNIYGDRITLKYVPFSQERNRDYYYNLFQTAKNLVRVRRTRNGYTITIYGDKEDVYESIMSDSILSKSRKYYVSWNSILYFCD